MEVYVVIDDNWQAGASINSIWSTLELAEAALEPLVEDDRKSKRTWGEHVIETWDVDEDQS